MSLKIIYKIDLDYNSELNMNHFSKPPRNPDYLIKILIDRGLTIDETEEIEIKSYIRKIGYFRLSGYFGPLQSEKDKFKDSTHFHDIIRLYRFDKELKFLTFKALERVEIQLRALLTDTYSIAHTSFWYADKELFEEKMEKVTISKCFLEDGELIERNTQIDISLYDALINEISTSVRKTEHSEFMRKFIDKYSADSPIPSWMIMESISFGKLSRLYALLKPSEEKKFIANQFGAVTTDYLVSWLHALVVLRNICAHHSRLWNRKIGKDIKMPTRKSNKFISDFNEENLRKYYGVSSCLLKIFNENDKTFMDYYKNKIHILFKKYDIDPCALGFPENFQNDKIWQRTDI